MSTAILSRSLAPASNTSWRDASPTYAGERRSSFSSSSSTGNVSSVAPVRRMVTVQEVVEQHEPVEGLLVIESDSEEEQEEDEESIGEKQPEREQIEETTYNDELPRKSSKPLPKVPEQHTILDFPSFPEPVIRPTMLTPIAEYNTEDDAESIPWSEDVWSQQDTSTSSRHQEKEQMDTSDDDDCQSQQEPDEGICILFDEKTALESDSEEIIYLHDHHSVATTTSAEKIINEQTSVTSNQNRETCQSAAAPDLSDTKEGTMQKPFEPVNADDASTNVKDYQPPHTPEESIQPTIWSVDDSGSTASSEKDKPPEQDTIAPPPTALSPSPSLCSRCSSISSLLPMQNGQSDSVPSSATSIVSTQDLLLKPATTTSNQCLGRPQSMQSLSERPSSVYSGANNVQQHGCELTAADNSRRPLSAAWDSLASLPLAASSLTQPQSTQQPTSLVQEVRRMAALQKSQSSSPPAQPNVAPTPNQSKSRLSIASFSLTHNKGAIKIYRRMASKTRNTDIQMTYAKYLLEIARLYGSNSSDRKGNNETRERLLTEAGYWIDRLAKHGKAEALYIKGKWHLQPNKEDCAQVYQRPQPLKAFKCLQAAAKAGWVEAYYDLARYRKTRGEYNQAVACYKIASSKGHTLATYKLAKILLRGQLQQKRDIRQGLEYLRAAADSQGPDSAEPAYVLSCVYTDELERIGISRDSQMSRKNIPLGMQYLEKAVSLGLPTALHRMGQIHEQGLFGRPRDPWQGYLYFTRAAEDGHEGAMLELSRIYTRGIPGHLMVQHEIAFKWCQRAADKGLAQAEFVLGTYYEMGVGTVADYAKALEYYGKAASKGYSPAAEKLNLPVAMGAANPLKKNENKHNIVDLQHFEPPGTDCKIM